MPLEDIWDLINLGWFDPINQMILLTVIPLSGAHCIIKISFMTNKLLTCVRLNMINIMINQFHNCLKIHNLYRRYIRLLVSFG